MRLWRNKIFQVFVQVFIMVSIGVVSSKLTTLQHILEYESTKIGKEVVDSLVKDIKLIKVISTIVWMLAIGFCTNFIYSINQEKIKNNNEQ